MVKNLNKLFLRLSISTKLVIAFLGVGVLPLIGYGAYSVWSMSRHLEEQALKNLRFQIDQTGQNISGFLTSVEHDLTYLKTLSPLRRLATMEADGASAEDEIYQKARQAAIHSFQRFSQGKRSYYQLRYLNADGWEVIRLNRGSNGLVLVAHDALQNKAHRYYVSEGLACAPDEIYVSPMDLNIEHGIVEIPLRPVVRYATPVVDERGKKQGLLIVNIFAEAIFEIIGGVPDNAGSYLTDAQGLYLYQSSHTASLDYFRNRSLHDDYSREVVAAVLSEGSGLTHAPDYILAHARIGLAVSPDDSWVLVLAVPRQVVLSSVFRLESVFVGLLMLIAATVVILGILAARHFVRPILQLTRGADLLARGQFENRIEVQTNDELEDLSGHFNNMARQLGKSQKKLQRWNEELQSAVVSRTKELMISEAQLRIEKQKLDDIVSSIGAELCLIDRDHKVVWVNKTLADRCNGHGAAMGRACHDLFYGFVDGACQNCQCDFSFQNRVGGNVVVSRPAAQGAERIFQVITTPVVDVDGEVSHLLAMHLDITESVQRERDLQKQSAEKERLASQVLLAAGVIHEVAKPLAAMKTTIQVLEDEIENSEQRTYLSGVESEIDQLGEFLQTFSKYARPRAITRQPCKLVELVQHVKLLIQKEAERRNVTLELRNLHQLPEAMLDSIQLQQVLLNICVNAFDAMPDGGTITIAGAEVREPAPGLQLSVSDTGAGIAEDKLHSVFDAFFSDKPSGTGLGLAIVKQIIDGHGGQIRLESELGAGATFVITLPYS